jgi:hypothetical protein
MYRILLFVGIMLGTTFAVAQEADENKPPPPPEPVNVAEGPFQLDAYSDVSDEDRAKVRDLLRALKLVAPDAELSALHGRTVTPPAPEVISTPDLFVTRMSDLIGSDLGAAATASGDAPNAGPACTFTCTTISGLAQGFCMASFKGQTAALCLAASSAASDSCTAGCPK